MKFQPEKFSIHPKHIKPKNELVSELKRLMISAVKKNAPKEKFGIMFSGGVDSTTIAIICKSLGLDFTCYTAAFSDKGIKEAEDLSWAIRVAKEYGFKLKKIKLNLKKTQETIKKILPIIKDDNVVKMGVALPVYLVCEQAKKDGIKQLYSGLGSEEIFAGYQRHVNSKNVNDECLKGLFSIERRDLSRDIPIAKHFKINLKAPFLDEKLINYSLKIPSKYKLDNQQNKKILREVAEELGLKKEFAQRKKRAAQYGSKFDRAILKLSKTNGFRYKSDYINSLTKTAIGAMISGGKDSLYAMYKLKKENHPIKCIIKIKSDNPDSYMFHTPGIDIVDLQAEALNIPIVEQKTKGIKELELTDLKKALKKAKDKYNIQGITTGALYSTYQKDRIGKICDELDLKAYSPLWHKDQETEMREILKNGFEFVFTSIAADGLDKSWLNKKITDEEIDELVKLNEKIGLNIAGEGGEFESLVLDMPMFNKKIKIEKSKIVMENKCTGRMIIDKVKLKKK